MNPYSSEQMREIARKVIINDLRYLEMKEHQEDNNSLELWLDLCCELPGRDGALMKQLRHWLAVNAPGLLDRVPVPDSFCRRAREVKKEMRDKKQVQPALQELSV